MVRFDEIKGFKDGFAPVKKHGKWSYIGQDGKLICPLQYDVAEHFSEGYARVKKFGKWFFIDTEGNIMGSNCAIELLLSGPGDGFVTKKELDEELKKFKEERREKNGDE